MKKTATIFLFSLTLVFSNIALAQPGASTLTLPANNSVKVATNINLVWNSPSPVDSFRVQVSLDTSFTSFVINAIQGDANVFSVPTSTLSNFVTYYWRVRGKDISGYGDWSDTSVFRTIDRVSPSPALITPKDNSKTSPMLPDFLWGAVVRAQRYQIQVSENSGFTTQLVDTVFGNSTNAFTYTKDTLDLGKVYFWRARSENENGWGNWATPSSFEVLFLPPSAPTLLTPVNGATNQPLNQRLDWGNSNQTTRYRLYLSTSPALTNASIFYRDSSLLRSFFDLPIANLLLDSSRTYYWTVAAGNDDDFYSRNSDTFSFTTINLLPPLRPTNLSPKTASVQHSRRPIFTWRDNSVFAPDSFYLHISTFFIFTDTAALIKTTTPNYTMPASGPLGFDTVFYWRVAGKNAAGFSPWSFFWNLTTSLKKPIKDAFKANLYPNPAITATTFDFELHKAQNVRIAIIDITGKEILNIYSGQLNANKHSMPIDISTLANGNYYIAIAGETAMQTIPFIKQ